MRAPPCEITLGIDQSTCDSLLMLSELSLPHRGVIRFQHLRQRVDSLRCMEVDGFAVRSGLLLRDWVFPTTPYGPSGFRLGDSRYYKLNNPVFRAEEGRSASDFMRKQQLCCLSNTNGNIQTNN